MTTSNIEVRVSKRVLWIGADAYPLQNIARAQVRTLYPRHDKLVGKFIKTIIRWIGVGVVAAIIMAVLGVHNSPSYALLIVLLLSLISAIRLAGAIKRERRKRPYYLLIIQTAGDPQTLLASPDRNQIDELVNTIMAAVDDAGVTYNNWIENHGDIISQYGYDNIGKINV